MINTVVNRTMRAILHAGLRQYRPHSTVHTALILVHVQPPFLEGHGDLTSRLGQLVTVSRDNGMPVFRSVFDASAPVQYLSPALRMMRSRVGMSGAAELPAGLYPTAADIHLPATTNLSAFHETGLAEMLASAGIERLVVAGTFADIGVDSTARDATERDFYTTVISDCCGAQTEAGRDAALSVTIPRMVQHVTTLADWISEVGGKPAHPGPAEHRPETQL